MANGEAVKTTPLTLEFTINLPFIATVVAAMLFQSATNAKSDTRINNIEAATAGLDETKAQVAVLDERTESMKATLGRIEMRVEAVQR